MHYQGSTKKFFNLYYRRRPAATIIWIQSRDCIYRKVASRNMCYYSGIKSLRCYKQGPHCLVMIFGYINKPFSFFSITKLLHKFLMGLSVIIPRSFLWNPYLKIDWTSLLFSFPLRIKTSLSNILRLIPYFFLWRWNI